MLIKEAVERRPSAAARGSAFKLKGKGYLRKMLSRRQLHAFVILPIDSIIQRALSTFGGSEMTFELAVSGSSTARQDNDGLQLRRAISIQPEGTKLLEKHAIAPSAARPCFIAPSC